LQLGHQGFGSLLIVLVDEGDLSALLRQTDDAGAADAAASARNDGCLSFKSHQDTVVSNPSLSKMGSGLLGVPSELRHENHDWRFCGQSCPESLFLRP
jgi:hypothetical protein